MKNILLPTDFSNDAYNALHYATQLLGSEACTFHLLNIYNEHTALRTQRVLKEGGRVLIRQLEDESKEGLLETLHRINRDVENPNISFKTISEKGGLLERIKAYLKKAAIDFVVMGNKGKIGFKDILGRGNTPRALGKIEKCPILMVPRETEFVSPKKIALATYYKRNFSENVLDPLFEIAKDFNASILVMHIDEKEDLDAVQKSNRKLLKKQLEGIDHSIHWRPYYADKVIVIDDFVRDMGVDMLVMVNYEHNLLEKLIRQPIIKDIGSEVNIPFMVIPCQD